MANYYQQCDCGTYCDTKPCRRCLEAEMEQLREELRLARGELTPTERRRQDFVAGVLDDRQDNS